MIRSVGILFLGLSCVGIGVLKGRELNKRVEQLKKLKKFIYMLKSEIKYMRSPLPDAFLELSKRVESPLSTFLIELSSELSECERDSFYQVWEEQVEKHFRSCGMTKEDLEGLCKMGESMGFLGQEMQENTLSLYLQQLDISLAEAREEESKKVRVYHYLGVSFGLFIMILLI